MKALIRLAKPDDLERVELILEEARAWLHSQGIAQWLTTYPRHLLATTIERGEVYLAEVAGALAGTITLQEAEDPVWAGLPSEAIYVHCLAVRREFAGHGMGRQLLQWAEQLARTRGRPFVRLDCWAGNPKLCSYYEEAGFVSRGDRQEADYQVRLYEKSIGNME
jgi:GNAT superfamily N-acetyltransferase